MLFNKTLFCDTEVKDSLCRIDEKDNQGKITNLQKKGKGLLLEQNIQYTFSFVNLRSFIKIQGITRGSPSQNKSAACIVQSTYSMKMPAHHSRRKIDVECISEVEI